MSKNPLVLKASPAQPTRAVLNSIIHRAHAHAMTMIYLANHRDNIEKGDPKVGGHHTASSSALHVLSCLHQVVKNPQDFVACKPHASPTDHANNYLLRLFFESDKKTRMNDERMKIAMRNLRAFSQNNEPVFQSYHSAFDPDHWQQLPSGSVGIPPVNAVYLAHAFRMAETHGHKIPSDAHFWCLMGDSEYREGSLAEVLPEVSERGLGNVTWILDYNRQSLDGHRILNEDAMGGKDNDRIEKTALANGWEVQQVRHGGFRLEVMGKAPYGEALQNVLENALPDYELQSLLAKLDAKTTVEAFAKYDKGASQALKGLSESEVNRFLTDMGGHDTDQIIEAFENSKKDPEKPVFLVVHTIKGWNLQSAAKSANHSAMMSEEEIHELRKKYGLTGKDLFTFEHFEEKSAEAKYLKERSDWLYSGMQAIHSLREENRQASIEIITQTKALENFPAHSGINLKMVPMAHTQWMLGQITAKYARIAETSLNDAEVKAPFKALSEEEKKLKLGAEMLFSMAPDVGTSTNLNASMDGRIYGPEVEDFEEAYGVKDSKSPDIIPHQSERSRFVRFDIAESNVMSCMGSYGKMLEYTGVPMLPLMTVYDFFLKRALDQLFYNLYWQSSFICVGTPSGVTLSPEGAQHGWKSDFQIANTVTWEPAFALELDWIISESVRRHLVSFVEGPESPNGNVGRQGVIIRGVTRALEQKEMIKRLKTHQRFAGKTDDQILEITRLDSLEGAYYLADYRGFDGYRPSENVVHIFTMGSLITEALAASDALHKKGIFANVIQVSSTDLLLGNQAYKNNYRHLRQGLGITGELYLKASSTKNQSSTSYPPTQFGPLPTDLINNSASGMAQLLTLGGRRIPVVSVHDGEPGLLDNVGSVLGTLQKALAVRKHSKCGRPSDVYKYHGIDAASVETAVLEVLSDSAFTGIRIDAQLAAQMGLQAPQL